MTRDELARLLNMSLDNGRDFSIHSVTEDSRRACPGALFVAIAGGKTDGHAFADEAVKRGAVAVLGNRMDLKEIGGAPYLYAPLPRQAAALVAHAMAGDPTAQMTVIGVTGTNGKTSTALLVQSILRQAGHPTACLGTLGYDVGGKILDAPHTTPFGEELAEMFRQAHDSGQTHAVMEVSSHALEQERVAGIHFHSAGFTNLTQDHLDYHQNMEAYREAKLKLFRRLKGPGATAVINADDPSAKLFREAANGDVISYGARGDIRATRLRMEAKGTTFQLHTPWGESEALVRLLGKHNVYNAMCAIGLAGAQGVPLALIIDGVAALKSVPGRLESIDCGQPFYVVVDYAHTEDGLRNVITAARALCKGRLIVVFGCGGDRDKTKRPKMGAVAAGMSDYAILTSDNPRTEDPYRILLDVEVGVQRTGKKKEDDYLVIESREDAIRRAIGMAKEGDFVLIAGKGHEDYQIVGTTKNHFDDREVARKVLGEL